MLFGAFTVLTRHIVPFIWLKDLIWQCGGAAEEGGGGEGCRKGRARDSLCCNMLL